MTKTRSPIANFEKEINELTAHLIELSIVDSYNLAVRRDHVGDISVLEAGYWSNPDHSPDIFSRVPYDEFYTMLSSNRSYDLRFLDGALAQLRFEFKKGSRGQLLRSRLAYFPSPDLTPYQKDPEIYLSDEIYGDVVDVRSVGIPFRFDYDSSEDTARDLHHPKSHVTLGQYPHCRIAASGPITPYYFVEFVLRSFYRTSSWLATPDLPKPRATSSATLTRAEISHIHFGLPTR
jgi:hypothetical protein